MNTGGVTRSATVYLGIMGAGLYRSTDGGDTFAAMTGLPSTIADLNPI